MWSQQTDPSFRPIGSTTKDFDAEKDKMGILGMIVGSNPVAASALEGVQKAAKETAYKAVASGTADVNQVLSDIVSKFGGGVKQIDSVGNADAVHRVPQMAETATPQQVSSPTDSTGASQATSTPQQISLDTNQDPVMAGKEMASKGIDTKNPTWMQRFAFGYMAAIAPDSLPYIAEGLGFGGKNLGEMEEYITKKKIDVAFDLDKEIQKASIDKSKKADERATAILDKIAEPVKLTGDSVGMYTASKEISKYAEKLVSAIKDNPDIMKSMGNPMNEESQRIVNWANQVKTNTLFQQGGKALTDTEIKFINTILAQRGLGAYLQSPNIALEIMEGITAKASSVQKAIDPYSSERDIVTIARNSGKYSDGQILKILEEKRTRDARNK